MHIRKSVLILGIVSNPYLSSGLPHKYLSPPYTFHILTTAFTTVQEDYLLKQQ